MSVFKKIQKLFSGKSKIFLGIFSLLLLGIFLAMMLSFVFAPSATVIFESEESKTLEGKPVFNQVWLEKSDEQEDIWAMRQSHHGAKFYPADQLRIVINKNTRPYRASFFQYSEKNGKAFEEVQYRASCFACHANGPRALRPVLNSEIFPLEVKSRLLVALWNFKIKSYGRVETAPETLIKEKVRAVKLKFEGAMDQDILKVKTCLYCHSDGSDPDGRWWQNHKRAPLLRQHAMSIQHLVETNQMPPFPFKLEEAEREAIQQFINGM